MPASALFEIRYDREMIRVLPPVFGELRGRKAEYLGLDPLEAVEQGGRDNNVVEELAFDALTVDPVVIAGARDRLWGKGCGDEDERGVI